MNCNKIKVMYLVLEMDLGGLQRIVNLLIRNINQEQFMPYLCCLDRGGLFFEQLKSDSIKTYILQRKPGPFDLRLFIKLCRILKEEKIDIVHSQNGCTLYAALAGRLTRVKSIIHTDHGRLVPDRWGAIIEDRFLSLLIDKFIGVSEELTEYLASKVRINRKKLMTIINGVDTERFKPINLAQQKMLKKAIGLNDRDKIIGTVCRLDPIKNLEFLINYMPSICEAVPECKLLIVGDGPHKEHLIAHTRNLGLESKVIFLGRKADIENILPLFDIYVNTSLSEGTSMTILEAMACGLPIVASAVGGNKKLVDDSNGRLFSLNDTDGFKRNIIELFKRPELLDEMSKNSRRKVEDHFSLEQMVKQYEQLYCSLY